MELLKSDLINGHLYIKLLEQGKHYTVSLKHDHFAKFILEILNHNDQILDRPNDYLVTALPHVPYSITFKAISDGLLAIHYDEAALNNAKWTKVYDIDIREEETI